ncbi:hypothetical protein CO173_02905 [Candidatus Uhrbacteria bacterium CG_4_9_14_3_um_filter_41_35]|uniref:Uncharacterized protein n=1 Tax=Candidatus Uhrbacteria bacterium CG_4_9_14_3_um_filter_41_35 TaxID=1975034 RepID=A0A2M7XFQ4_9BACT|nr:MAG: hypothetical protein COV92_00775 [Candidatus Uhrbacteria bacterium CG11_big_fil_rev_8_21_14_0_20_41_9]PJA46692.1 MAG: hypothetical protein CO173_02905 [Candidatus Uhrbacteria bacterium CG_4_9_14_3_um_filter_41_35]
MHMPYRTWFPFILIGVAVSFTLFVATFWQPTISRTVQIPPVELPVVMSPTTSQYETEINTIVITFETTGSAESAYTSLLDLRVPAEFKEFHFNLVVAFGDFKLGNTASGQARLDLLKKATPWLNQ